MNFHETMIGQKFFQAQLPALTKAIERLAEATEKANKIAVSAPMSPPANESEGYKVFKTVIVDNLSIDAISSFVQGGDNTIFEDNIKSAFLELLTANGCCPKCEGALFYSDISTHDYYCSKCNHYFHKNEIAVFPSVASDFIV